MPQTEDIQSVEQTQKVESIHARKPLPISLVLGIILVLLIAITSFAIFGGAPEETDIEESTATVNQDAFDIQDLDQSVTLLEKDLTEVDNGLNDTPEKLE